MQQRRKEAVICGTLKAVIHDVGLDHMISDEELARGSPCEGTIANWELELAAACVTLNVAEIHLERIRAGKEVVLGLIMDHIRTLKAKASMPSS